MAVLEKTVRLRQRRWSPHSGMVLVDVFNLKLRTNLLWQGEGEMMSHEIRRGEVNQPQVEGTGKLQRNSQSKQLFVHQI